MKNEDEFYLAEQKRHGFNSAWCIPGVQDFAAPAPKRLHRPYVRWIVTCGASSAWPGMTCALSEPLPAVPTWLDLWAACETLYNVADNPDRQFIEMLTPVMGKVFDHGGQPIEGGKRFQLLDLFMGS